MAQPTFSHRFAALLRRFPLFIRAVYSIYRIIQPKYTVGVTGILFNASGQVLLVEHLFHPRLPWGLPGGWTNRNEDPEDAVRRELREELSVDVTIHMIVHAKKTMNGHLDIAFWCRAHSDIGRLSYELLGYAWYNIADLPHLHKFQYDAIQQAHSLLTRMTH